MHGRGHYFAETFEKSNSKNTLGHSKNDMTFKKQRTVLGTVYFYNVLSS